MLDVVALTNAQLISKIKTDPEDDYSVSQHIHDVTELKCKPSSVSSEELWIEPLCKETYAPASELFIDGID